MRNNHEYTLQERKQAEIDNITRKIAEKKKEVFLLNAEMHDLQKELDQALADYTNI